MSTLRAGFKSLQTKTRDGKTSQILIAGVAIGLNLLLVAPRLMPAFAEINLFDEAKYVESGARLLDFQLRDQALGPLVAVPYALLHAIFRGSPNWFMLEVWGGRFLLFIGLWVSVLYLAVKVGSRSLLLVASGILFLSFYFIRILPNQSDALFVILSALVLASLVSFQKTFQFRDIWVGSALTALATLTRVEAILLLPLYMVLVVIIGWREYPRVRMAAGAILPAIVVLSAFALISLVSTQALGFGIGSRAYDSFEWNQSILTGGDLVEAKKETDRLFGTREENEGSVLRAISSNPSALLDRIIANAKSLPDEFLGRFGKRIAPFILLFAGIGALALIRTGSVAILGILAVWAIQPFVSLAFIAIHIIPQTGYIILVLAAVGAASIFGIGNFRFPMWALLILTALVTAYAIVDRKPAFLPGGLLLGAITAFVWLAEQSTGMRELIRVAGLLLFFSGGLILRGPFSFPNFPSLGDSSIERAILVIQERLPAGSRLAVEHPGIAIAASMEPIEFGDGRADLGSRGSLCELIEREKIGAFYVPVELADEENELWSALQAAEGGCVDTPLIFDPGSIRVFFTNY